MILLKCFPTLRLLYPSLGRYIQTGKPPNLDSLYRVPTDGCFIMLDIINSKCFFTLCNALGLATNWGKRWNPKIPCRAEGNAQTQNPGSHLIDETREKTYPELESWIITHAVHHLPLDLLHLSRAVKVQDGCPWAGRWRALVCETCVFRVGGDGREWQGVMKDGQGL